MSPRLSRRGIATLPNIMKRAAAKSSELERKLALVVQTGLLLNQSVELEKIVQAATDAGLELCGAEFGAFFYTVSNDAGESYQLYTLAGVDRERFANFPMPRKTALFGPTFAGTAIVRSGDITQDPRYAKNSPHAGMPAGHLPVRSYLAVPVKSQCGEVLGALFYGHAEPDQFAESAEELVALLAAQAGVAIENARLRTQLSRRLNELESAAERLSEMAAIVSSSEDAIASTDLDGRVMSWNDAATRILGFTAEDMIGRPLLRAIPENLHADEERVLAAIRAGQRVSHYDTVRVRKSGELIDVAVSASPIRDESGAIVGVSKILRDISTRKRMETSLLQAEKIAATGRMAATIAHEINNPMEAVMNLLFLLRPMIDDPAGIGYLETAESELTRVAHIAKQTLGYYREHASPTQASLADLAEQAAMVYAPRCRASGIRLVKKLDAVPLQVLRRGEMIQVISNLIANAIYAMPTGGQLEIAVRRATDARDGVVLTVRDNGLGIAEKNLSRIFEAFFTTRSTIGTGIGLFVARGFIEGHGGRIEVTSSTAEFGHGTTMAIYLPAHTAYEQAPAPPALERVS